MRRVLITLGALFLVTVSCKKEIDEVPSGIIKTVTNPELYAKISEFFPEHRNVINAYPPLFSENAEKQIVLTGESEVYVTFVQESARYRNTLGWYSYIQGHEPVSVSEIDKHVLFPNISEKDNGGQLQQGDMIQVGKAAFPKGTVIGFFLILDGWRDGSIDYGQETHYTDYNLNPGSHQNHIIFKEKDSGEIVLGFEDLPVDNRDADFDYNDILITVSDNKNGYQVTNIDTTRTVKM